MQSACHRRNLVERAEVSALNSPIYLDAFACHVTAASINEPKPYDLDDAIVSTRRLCDSLPALPTAQEWYGEVCLYHRTTAVLNDDGYENHGFACLASVCLRVRNDDTANLVDYVITVTDATLDHAIETAHRCILSAEIVRRPAIKTMAPPPGTRAVLGPAVVAKLLERSIMNSLDTCTDWPEIPMADIAGAGFGGVDDEGVPIDVLGANPPLGPWATLSTMNQGGKLVGRGFRPTIGGAPRLRPLGLTWLTARSVAPPRYVLVNDLLGMRLTRSGVVAGTALRSPLIVGGESVAQCDPFPIHLEYRALFQALSDGATTTPNYVGPHFLPGVLVS